MIMKRRRPLVSKVIVGISAAILLIEGIRLVPTSLIYSQELVDARRESAALVARLVLRRHEDALAKEGAAALPAIAAELERCRADLGGAAAFVFDRAGGRVGGAIGASPRAEQAVADALAAWKAGGMGPFAPGGGESAGRGVALERAGTLVYALPLAGAGGPAGALVLAAPLDAVAGKVANHVLLAVGLVLLTLLFTGVVAISSLYAYVLQPLKALSSANRALVDGDDRHALVPEEEIPTDELGEVIRSRNEIYLRMLEYQASIRDKNEILRRQGLELKRWTLALEDRVRQKSRELSRAHERLLETEKLAATGRLAAGLAHEINNPLASIAGYAEDLLSLAKDPALSGLPAFREFPESLAVIESQAYRCKRIIRQLLSFARPAPFRIEPVALGTLLQEVIPLVEHKARGREVALAVDVDPDCPPALADRANLVQVLVNLLENAYDAIDAPTGRVTIAVDYFSADGDVVAIQVRDTGCGIPEAHRTKIFDPFFTTKPVGSGTGLGLSIVHSIVSRLEGTIEVASEVGRGTIVTVTLPAARGARMLETVASLPPTGIYSPPPRRGGPSGLEGHPT